MAHVFELVVQEKEGVHGSNKRRRTVDHFDASGSNQNDEKESVHGSNRRMRTEDHYGVDGSNQNDLLRLTLYKKETTYLLKVSDYLHEDLMASLKDWTELFHEKSLVEKEVDPISEEKEGVHSSNRRMRTEDHYDAGGSNQNDLLRLTLYKKETARLLKASEYLHEDLMASLKDWAELFHGKSPIEKEVDPISEIGDNEKRTTTRPKADGRLDEMTHRTELTASGSENERMTATVRISRFKKLDFVECRGCRLCSK
ncbi:hypothetical protein Q3G72_002840 [Acer saccharum]|nr:hypothetical protein Q3G72_002840 [Acer saccharum]